MKSVHHGLAVALVLLTNACDKDPVSDDGDFVPRDSATLAVNGHGEVQTRFTAEVAVAGQWIYTTTWSFRAAPGNALFVWNGSGGTPVLRDSVILDFATTLGDVQIADAGDLLVVATERSDGSIVIFDRSDPDNLVQLARHISENTGNGVHTVKLGSVGNRDFAFLSVNAGGVMSSQLVIVDITDPANPIEILVRPMGNPFIHDVFVRDGLLFTALWDNGMTIWDIGGGSRGGTPENPVQISNIVTQNGNVHNIWWFHDPSSSAKRYVFVGEEAPGVTGAQSSGDIHVVDISDIENPREVAFYTLAGAGTHNFAMDEPSGILYAAYYNGGVRALDVRGNLGVCPESARAPDGRCNLGLAGRVAGVALADRSVSIWGVGLNGSTLYASDMLSGIFSIDVAPLIR
ncbi:MAG: LVIVD repeat-containing protein [Longimicrobiales bacterium]